MYVVKCSVVRDRGGGNGGGGGGYLCIGISVSLFTFPIQRLIMKSNLAGYGSKLVSSFQNKQIPVNCL